MYQVNVVTHFSGAHQLRNSGGKCESLHGHNWKIEITLKGEKLNETGLLMDFREIKDMTNEVLQELDHSFLNELPYFKQNNPSSENIAFYVFDRLDKKLNNGSIKVAEVTVWESDFTSATYME